MMPSGWKFHQLDDLVDSMSAGVSVNSDDSTGLADGPRVLKTSSVTSGVFLPGESKRIVDSEVSKARTSPVANSIIMSRMNTQALVGASAYVAEAHPKHFLPDRLWLLQDSKKQVSMKWLSSVLGSGRMRSRISGMATGTSGSMKNISKESILSLEILTPPKDEQEKIAKVLSTWDEAIEKTNALIGKQKSLRSYFRLKLLNIQSEQLPASWSIKKIGEVCSTKSGGTPSRKKPEYYNGTIPWVKSGEVNSVRIFDTEEKITQEAIANSSAKIIPRGTVVVAMYGATAGKVGFLEIDAALNQAVLAVTPDNTNLIPNYTFHLLTELLPKKLSLAQGGQANLSAEIIKSIEVSLPPIAEQEKIAAALSSLDEIISTLDKIKDNFSLQKQGLMQQLLTGKKRVKV